MVSFQCEGCGDVLTKKKLDPHRNHCRGAVFTCLDCMTTFRATEYRSHTSCITEDQKYQGALYREKPSKASKRKSVSILEPNENNALVPRPAYVEDAPDVDTPPHVPTPPPAVPANNRDSVFDYMVEEDQPNTPQIAFSENKEEMSMKNGAPSVFSSRASSRNGHRKDDETHSQEYEDQGYTYGAGPVNPRLLKEMNGSLLSLDFMTPAAKATKAKLDRKEKVTPGHSRTNSGSEKKRKRPTEEHIHELEGDTLMVEPADNIARSVVDTPGVIHSGLTGGLNRMMTEDNTFPSPESPVDEVEYHHEKERSTRRPLKQEDPASPLKRTRHSKDDSNGLGISIKGRAGKALSMIGGALLPAAQHEANTKTRRRASSSDHGQSLSRGREGEKRDRKKHKVHRHNGTSSSNVRHDPRTRRRASDESPEAQRRKVKAIEYKKHDDSLSDSEDERKRGGNAQMVIFGEEEKNRRRCQSFLSNIPGTDSDKGYSVNKALKRWHRSADVRSTSVKLEEEKELWRHLRLRKNDRGEIVIFF